MIHSNQTSLRVPSEACRYAQAKSANIAKNELALEHVT